MDIKALVDKVYSESRIRVQENDPLFALVALNKVILAELLELQQAAFADSLTDLDQRMQKLTELNKNTGLRLAELVQALKEDIQRTGKAEVLNVAEAVREGAIGAVAEPVAKAVATANEVSKIIQAAANQLAAKPATIPASQPTASPVQQHRHGITWGQAAGLVVFGAALSAVLVVAGLRYVSPLMTGQSEQAKQNAAWAEALSHNWNKLPQNVTADLNKTVQEILRAKR